MAKQNDAASFHQALVSINTLSDEELARFADLTEQIALVRRWARLLLARGASPESVGIPGLRYGVFVRLAADLDHLCRHAREPGLQGLTDTKKRFTETFTHLVDGYMATAMLAAYGDDLPDVFARYVRMCKDAADRSEDLANSISVNAKKAQAQVDKAQTALDKGEAKILAVLSEAEDRAKAIGVEAHKNDFGIQEDQHHNASLRWLAAAFFMFMLVVIYTACSVLPSTDPARTATQPTLLSIGALAGKLSLLSLGLVGLGFAIGNYRRHMHLWAVNKHKRVAMDAFGAFVAGASSQRTKDAVLEIVARSIYATPSTGYARESTTETALNVPISVRQAATRAFGPKETGS